MYNAIAHLHSIIMCFKIFIGKTVTFQIRNDITNGNYQTSKHNDTTKMMTN